MMNNMIDSLVAVTAGLMATVLVVGCIAAWITHVVVCIAANTASAVALLLVGIAIPPVGIIHGVCYWLGYSWVAGA